MRLGPGFLKITVDIAIVVVVGLGLALLIRGSESRGEPAAPADTHTSAKDPATPVTTQQSQNRRPLTPEEERVIVHKGTERPFTGEYVDRFDKGVYVCRRCGAMLYRSDDKFRSNCGWPAFDDEIPGAVERVPDADGVRTEIVCANCSAHLGHVFAGEHLTDKNTRHCVNSISLLFVPAAEVKYGRAIFAGGCFWGVEYWFEQQPGVIEATSGYTGGTTPDPTYEMIHSRHTGHAEAVEVLFDPVRVSFEQLAKLFFEIHDPTQRNGQGPDLGAEYRSAIFCTDEAQKQVADQLIAELRARGMDIATQVAPAGTFWPAEDYHQDYYALKGSAPVCHNRRPLW